MKSSWFTFSRGADVPLNVDNLLEISRMGSNDALLVSSGKSSYLEK